MENHSANFTPLVQDSFSSPSSCMFPSSSLDGISFILEDSDNDIMPIVQDLLKDETYVEDMTFLLQVWQATQDMRPSSSMPQAKRRFIRTDR